VPTYQYACTECGHAFEQFQSFSDDALTECPECQGRLRKVFNAVGVVFKGSGFYRTDSREKSTSSASSSDTKTETKSEPKTETKTETKSETKSESKAPATAG
jgi:putative FmdB family regulatory protein